MSALKSLFIVTVLVVVGALLYPKLFPSHELSLSSVEDKCFGKSLKAGQSIPEDSVVIKKFSVNVSQEVLEDLRTRLSSARFVTPIDGTNFNYGFNGNYLKELVDYWLNKFEWRKQELVLNKFNQYKTQINGINVHYIHVKPTKPVKHVISIMVVHGWPGSVFEYYKSIPILTEPVNDVAFEVIAPSIPGYGFSDAPQQQGFDILQTARVFKKLMDRLIIKRFIVHGGDWGSMISRVMALLYPDNVRGLHLTFAMIPPMDITAQLKLFIGNYFPGLVFDNPELEHKKLYPQWDKIKFQIRETGYLHIQATKPDTVGAALMDSPVGLLAYIGEKFSTWTDPNNVDKPDGGLSAKFTRDELITNVMIYWISNNVYSSMRYYKENFPRLFEIGLDRLPVSVPTAICDFPHELMPSSQTLLKPFYTNLVQYHDMSSGGHFAAFEEPKLVVEDIRQFAIKVLRIENNN